MKYHYLLFLSVLLSSQTALSQCPRQQALDNYRNKYLTSNFTNEELNWTGDINACNAGRMSENVRLKHLQRINYYRELVGGLTTNIVFTEEKNQQCEETVLMFEAQNTPTPSFIELNHCVGVGGAPCNTFRCTSSDAIEGAANGNIAFSFPNWNFTQPIDQYMLELGDFNRDVAHRRWILYSKAQDMGIATSTRFNSMWVVDGFSNPSVYEDFIAYPPNGYMPQPLMPARWSFGIPDADFSVASVTMQDENGFSIPVSIISRDRNFFGDNSIVWEPNGIDLTNADDVSYTVSILNVRSAAQRDYTYETTIMVIEDKDTETVADFTIQMDDGEVFFTDASTNADSWLWDFGNDNTSTEQNVDFRFDPGTHTICLTAMGSCGSNTKCEVIEVMEESILLEVGGTIRTIQDQPVPEVTVEINSTTQQTDQFGRFQNMFLSQDTYNVRPFKNDDPAFGISIADAIPIQRHILGISSIPTPYQLIAADVNGSGTITTFDIVTLRRMVLGTINEFPNGIPAWRFIPTNFSFPNPMDPFESGIPNQYTFVLTDPQDSLDFIAVKIGDVNGSALGSNFLGRRQGLDVPVPVK